MGHLEPSKISELLKIGMFLRQIISQKGVIVTSLGYELWGYLTLPSLSLGERGGQMRGRGRWEGEGDGEGEGGGGGGRGRRGRRGATIW